jgi:hypothetical protein
MEEEEATPSDSTGTASTGVESGEGADMGEDSNAGGDDSDSLYGSESEGSEGGVVRLEPLVVAVQYMKVIF